MKDCRVCGEEYFMSEGMFYGDPTICGNCRSGKIPKKVKIKCPHCGNHLIKLKGKNKMAIQLKEEE